MLQFQFDSFNKRETRWHLPFVLQVLFSKEVNECDLLLLDPLPEEAPGRQRVAHHTDGIAEQHLEQILLVSIPLRTQLIPLQYTDTEKENTPVLPVKLYKN